MQDCCCCCCAGLLWWIVVVVVRDCFCCWAGLLLLMLLLLAAVVVFVCKYVFKSKIQFWFIIYCNCATVGRLVLMLNSSQHIPEQARESGVSLVLSLWASISAPWSRRISTTPEWPAVAARMSGVKPFLSRCSKLAPRCSKTRTSSSCPPAQASVNAGNNRERKGFQLRFCLWFQIWFNSKMIFTSKI